MQNQEKKPVFHKGKNLIVIAVIAALAAALLLIALFSRPAQIASPLPTQDPARASEEPVQAFLIISVAGRLYGIEPLDEEREVEITQPTGEKNVIHISRNAFHMASSTCDNQLCIGQGEVTTDNYARRILGPYVLCLPNQVELQLVVPGATASPDAPDN